MKTRSIGPSDVDYPEGMSLLELVWGGEAARSPPLYVRGTLPSQPGIAVVGTREATQPARRFTGELVTALAAEQCSIWSGGALGVDCCAHQAALAAGAPTVVVTAGGLDDPYPPEHVELYERVLAAGGAMISLQPDGASRRRYHFVHRNYVMAALTLATVVTQAPVRSGARHTAGAARRLRRPLFVVPGEPWSRKGGGSALELVKGGTPIATPGDLVAALRPALARTAAGRCLWPSTTPWQAELWPQAGQPRRAQQPPRVVPGERLDDRHTGDDDPPDTAAPSLDEHAMAVLAALSDGPAHTDSLCTRLGLSYGCVSKALLTLCLGRVVVEGPPGHYRRER
ncbi:MAG: DNA-processing protein DprA [Deltaproteobacteria bacterium]|nr:DNA-processing protein DprA [Deltaproteobacteria bacterium]